jgi:hypothetical protein
MPKTVDIFGRRIPIKYLSPDEMLKLYPNPQGNAAQGLWDSSTRTIYINTDYPKQEQTYTLFHEMGHTVLTWTGLDLILPPEIQEILVQTFATLIEDIVKQAHKFKEAV